MGDKCYRGRINIDTWETFDIEEISREEYRSKIQIRTLEHTRPLYPVNPYKLTEEEIQEGVRLYAQIWRHPFLPESQAYLYLIEKCF